MVVNSVGLQLRLLTWAALALVTPNGFAAGAADAKTREIQNQSPSQTTNSATVIHTASRLVLVDVVVTDKHGRPVLGLNAGDFRVLENGVPQKIEFFESDGSKAKAPLNPAEGSTSVVLRPHEYSNSPPGQRTGTANIVLFDFLNTEPKDQGFAREQMLKFLATLPPGQQFALFVLGPRLHMVQGLTGDIGTLTSAAKSVRTRVNPLTTEDDREFDQDFIATIAEGPPPAQKIANGLAEELGEREAAQTTARSNSTVAAISSLARAVSGYSGRKNLLWLSGGFPLWIGSNLELPNPIRFPQQYDGALHNLGLFLASSDMAVYPIDVRGVKVTELGAHARHPDWSGAETTAKIISVETSHEMMDDIARQTGGEAFYNTNDLKGALARSVEHGAVHYTLSYIPSNRLWDGSYRSIKVSVNLHNVHLAYRRGYLAEANREAPDR
jgi:VWFA-related protein